MCFPSLPLPRVFVVDILGFKFCFKNVRNLLQKSQIEGEFLYNI